MTRGKGARAAAALLGLCYARLAAAGEAPDAGADAFASDDVDGAAVDEATERALPAPPVNPTSPATAPTPKPPPPVPATDPQQVAEQARLVAEQEARHAEASWPLRYVDRPQTMLKGMEDLFVTGRDAFGGPASYWRFASAVGYARGVTDQLELGLSIPSLICTGGGDGSCSGSVRPQLSARAALVEEPRARLDLGVSVFNFSDSATAWTDLQLVRPHRFSVEIEPLVLIGFAQRQTTAWWSPTEMQDGNQSRATLTFEGNVQLGEHVFLWGAAIPYLPLARLGELAETAVELAAGVGLAVTKRFEVGASCRAFNILAARHWEYVPDVRQCALTLLARGFGYPPKVSVSTVPVTRNLY